MEIGTDVSLEYVRRRKTQAEEDIVEILEELERDTSTLVQSVSVSGISCEDELHIVLISLVLK